MQLPGVQSLVLEGLLEGALEGALGADEDARIHRDLPVFVREDHLLAPTRNEVTLTRLKFTGTMHGHSMPVEQQVNNLPVKISALDFSPSECPSMASTPHSAVQKDLRFARHHGPHRSKLTIMPLIYPRGCSR